MDEEKYDFDRLEELVKKTREYVDPDRTHEIEKQFKNLRERLSNDAVFLKTTKNQLENIKFKFQQDNLKLTKEMGVDDIDKSLEDLTNEVESYKKKLEEIRERKNDHEEYMRMLPEPVDNLSNFRQTASSIVSMLENISKGEYVKEKGDEEKP